MSEQELEFWIGTDLCTALDGDISEQAITRAVQDFGGVITFGLIAFGEPITVKITVTNDDPIGQAVYHGEGWTSYVALAHAAHPLLCPWSLNALSQVTTAEVNR